MTHWHVFALAMVLGAILRMIYYGTDQNKIAGAISFIVPFALGILFWLKLYETGYDTTFYSTYVRGLVLSDQEGAKWMMIFLTSCAIAGLSWAFSVVIGAVIVIPYALIKTFFFDSKE